MLSYSFNQVGVFLEYILDIEAYTELYCKNKDRPETHCNGKCHLTSQLAENEEQKQNNDFQAPPEINLFLEPSQIDSVYRIELYIEEEIVFYFNADLIERIKRAIYRPPEVFI